MIRYIIRRLFAALLVVFAVSVVTFLIFQLAPALSHKSPVYYYVGKVPPDAVPAPPARAPLRVRPAVVGAVLALPARHPVRRNRHRRHRQCPLCGTVPGLLVPPEQLGRFVDRRRAPGQHQHRGRSRVLWLVGGVTVGTISGLRPGSIFDRVGMGLALAAVSLPIFFTGPLLLLVFEYKLKWLPNVILREHHVRPAAMVAEHDPALDRAGVPVRRALCAAHPGQHARNDG